MMGLPLGNLREILFRGKRVDNGEWVYGFYCKYGHTGQVKSYIIPAYASALYAIEVIPETVGQYTGLNDKNNTKIFDGDVVLHGFTVCVVKYDTDNARFMLYENGVYLTNGFNADTMKLKEVIGNVYDKVLRGTQVIKKGDRNENY